MLTVNFGERKQVHWLATQGRASTSEFVTEYIVQHSDDGLQWQTVTDPGGKAEVLKYSTVQFCIFPFLYPLYIFYSLCFSKC